MPTHAEKRLLPYSAEQMFDLVADVESYPDFLPWCVDARVRKRKGDRVVVCEMVIGYKVFRERFMTTDLFDRPRRIDILYTSGPFKHLKNHWAFEPDGDGRCRIDFYVDFEFRSRFLQRVMGAVFNEAVRLMVSSFEKRARQLYGEPRPAPGS